MFSQVAIKDTEEQPYVAIRSRVAIGQLENIIGRHLDEVISWLAENGVKTVGAPLIRYYFCPRVADPYALVDVSIGWPVMQIIDAGASMESAALPAGKYASLIYTGVENGIAGNEQLISWARNQGTLFDAWPLHEGEGFSGRVEYMLDGPEDNPDPSTWRTEVAIKIK
jgi:effector-binding domain-containing protein